MTPSWHFREFRPGDNVSDPDFARALFTRDDSLAARALVRESVQNSLDAASAGTAAVRVRFALRTGQGSTRSSDARALFDNLWVHLLELDDSPPRAESIPYLVVEDFGTRGLTGDPATWDPFQAGQNSFFLFFRALGRSGKEGEDRGRWGVGKFVFPMASRGHCLLALTIPETDPQPLVMGRAVLKTHRVGTTSYHPDGHWGLRPDDGLVLPVGDSATVQRLKATFNLQRTNEPGLSVVVPWVHETITASSLTAAAASEYFLPVLRRQLCIEIDDNGVTTRLDDESLLTMADSLEPAVTRARVGLGVDAATWPTTQLIDVGFAPNGEDFDWGTGRLDDAQRAHVASTLEAGRAVGFRVPTAVRHKEKGRTPTYFDVFLRQVPGLGRVRPLIVREGIAVSEDRTNALQDYVALVVVDHTPLASFVGDAETPAHNELQYDNVRLRYTLAGKLIQLLRSAPLSLIREIEGSDHTVDHSLLAEFFPRPAPTAQPRKPQPKGAREGDETPEVPPIPTRPARFRIGKTASGFTVRGTGVAAPGSRLVLDCAYDVRRGNPFKKYRTPDFAFGKDVAVDASGLTVDSVGENHLAAEVESPEFELTVEGFDDNRNVVVRVTVADPGADQ